MPVAVVDCADAGTIDIAAANTTIVANDTAINRVIFAPFAIFAAFAAFAVS